MGRIRTIKPGFFKHEDLYEAEKASGLPLRVAFSGLWTVCDREGRFPWKPRALKTDVLPYDDVDFSDVLDALMKFGFIKKYTAAGREYGQVPTWSDHQVINSREAKSVIPSPDAALQLHGKDYDASQQLQRGREGKGKEEEGGVITPEMITRGVLSELGLSGRDLAVVLDEVCRSQIKLYETPGGLRDALIESWRLYDVSKPKLSYTKGAAKFFGDGDWRNKEGWPWKDGQQPTGKRVYANG